VNETEREIDATIYKKNQLQKSYYNNSFKNLIYTNNSNNNNIQHNLRLSTIFTLF